LLLLQELNIVLKELKPTFKTQNRRQCREVRRLFSINPNTRYCNHTSSHNTSQIIKPVIYAEDITNNTHFYCHR